MNTKVISYLLGKISVLMGMAQLINLGLALYYGESCYVQFIVSILLAVGLGYGLQYYGRDATHKEISVREGIGTVFFAWILAAGLASVPFVLLQVLDPVSAYFEAMSGLTTTGATSISDLEVLPKSLLFWRAMNHWIGGIGIIVIFVALLPSMSGTAVYLYNAEVTGFSNSRILPRIRTTAIALFYIYLLLTIILTGILRGMGMSVYDAVYHACSCIATGGFSDYNTSVAHFKSPMIEYALSIFMVLAAGNFAVYYQVAQNGVKALWQDLEFKVYVVMVLCFTLAIAVNIILVNGYSLEGGFRSALFHVSTIVSSTGFAAGKFDFVAWGPMYWMPTLLLMAIGACAGSTGGGIKVLRILICAKSIIGEFVMQLHPKAILGIRVSGQIVASNHVRRALAYVVLFVVLVAAGTMLLSFMGCDVDTGLGSCISMLSNIGPGTGTTGPSSNFAHLPAASKWLLSFYMLIGRLEFFTVLFLFMPRFWKERK